MAKFITNSISLKQKWFSSKWKYAEAYFPAREVPDWFEYKEVGSSVLFCMPSIPIGQSRAMIVCAIYSVNAECIAAGLTIYFKNKTKGCETFDRSHYSFDWKICKDHAWVSYMTPSTFIKDLKAEEGDEIEVSIKPQGLIRVMKCGIHLPIRNWPKEQIYPLRRAGQMFKSTTQLKSNYSIIGEVQKIEQEAGIWLESF